MKVRVYAAVSGHNQSYDRGRCFGKRVTCLQNVLYLDLSQEPGYIARLWITDKTGVYSDIVPIREITQTSLVILDREPDFYRIHR